MYQTICFLFVLFLFPNLTIASKIQDLIILQNNYNPILFLLYKVNKSDFQNYIDPRFEVATFENDAYVIIHFANVEESSPPGSPSLATFPNIDIYTIVKYNSTLRRETLLTELKYLPGALLCQPTSILPYGCPYNNNIRFILDEEKHTYQYYSKLFRFNTLKFAEVNLTAIFNLNNRIDYSNTDDPPQTLASFALSQTTNKNLIQTFYTKQKPVKNQPIARGTFLTFYSPVYSCTINSIQSNFISATIGPIEGLDESRPSLCLYAPCGHANYSIVSYL